MALPIDLNPHWLASSAGYEIERSLRFNSADSAYLNRTPASAGNRRTFTLSFWVKSSLTGTFGGSINNSGNSRSYVFSYTISAANTWEQKTVTIAGDTSGTWLTTNGIGLIVRFSIAMGSTYTNTAGAWYSGDYEGATGQVNVLNTNGATFYITGVQLERGSNATSFEFRDYGRELILCQRYFQRNFDFNCYGLNNNNATTWYGHGKCHVTMRATPTTSIISGVTPSVDFMGVAIKTNNGGTPVGKNVNSWKFDMPFVGALGVPAIGVIDNNSIECSAEL